MLNMINNDDLLGTVSQPTISNYSKSVFIIFTKNEGVDEDYQFGIKKLFSY